MADTVRAKVFLQVEPDWARYGSREDPNYLQGARVVGHTQKRSQNPRPGSLEVAITVEIPKTAFLPLRPEAVVVIPDALTVTHPIEVEATDPNSEVA